MSYNRGMKTDPDMVTNPRAFAEAHAGAHRQRLQALTLEQAARELEGLFAMAQELEAAREALGAPPSEPPPLPRVSLAMLLAGAPHEDDAAPSGHRR